jgi:hypothetical protein
MLTRQQSTPSQKDDIDSVAFFSAAEAVRKPRSNHDVAPDFTPQESTTASLSWTWDSPARHVVELIGSSEK